MSILKSTISASLNRNTGMSPIYVTFYLNSEKIALPTKVSTKREWFKEGLVTKKDKDYLDKNLIIQNVMSKVNNILVKYRLREKNLTKSLFMSQWTRPTNFVDFYDFCEWYMQNHSHDVQLGTLKNHKTALKKLQALKPELQLEDLTFDVIMDFKGYLMNTLKNNRTTVNKNLGFIKKYALAALRMKLIEENPFEQVKISKSYDEVAEYLNEEELGKLCDLYHEHTLTPAKQRVLLFFLFMCFGSMHVGDAKQFCIEQIGSKYITYIRSKTKNTKGIQLYIPISKSLRFVLKEAKGRRAAGLLFPVLPTSQKINLALQKIAKSVGIEKHVCCKTGRHTFATLFAKNTHDLNTLKKLMGHTSLNETLRYAHVMEEDKLKAIHCFDGFI